VLRTWKTRFICANLLRTRTVVNARVFSWLEFSPHSQVIVDYFVLHVSCCHSSEYLLKGSCHQKINTPSLRTLVVCHTWMMRRNDVHWLWSVLGVTLRSAYRLLSHTHTGIYYVYVISVWWQKDIWPLKTVLNFYSRTVGWQKQSEMANQGLPKENGH